MTLQQILAFSIIAGTMALFVWGRLRYDLVAGVSLLVAVLVGVVPAEKAFSGFSDEIVVIVAGALIVSAGGSIVVRLMGYCDAGTLQIGQIRHLLLILPRYVP